MTLKKKSIEANKTHPVNSQTDIEVCHENIQDIRYSQIAENAYYKAEARGFEPGHELDDWIAAENEFIWDY